MIDAVAEARHDADQAADQPLQVGQSIPAVCTIDDLRRIFRSPGRPVMSRSTFHRREQRGDFKKFELRGGGKHEWSGYRIATFLTGGSFAITVRRS